MSVLVSASRFVTKVQVLWYIMKQNRFMMVIRGATCSFLPAAFAVRTQYRALRLSSNLLLWKAKLTISASSEYLIISGNHTLPCASPTSWRSNNMLYQLMLSSTTFLLVDRVHEFHVSTSTELLTFMNDLRCRLTWNVLKEGILKPVRLDKTRKVPNDFCSCWNQNPALTFF